MRSLRVVGALVLGLTAAGCASFGSQHDTDEVTISDPLEGMNRFFFDINQRLDRNAAKPAATVYKDTVPHGVRTSFHNVLDNLGGPVTVANDLLQAQFENAGIAAGRFVINTTIGVAGIFDVATDWGMPERSRDFGLTLGTIGIPPVPIW